MQASTERSSKRHSPKDSVVDEADEGERLWLLSASMLHPGSRAYALALATPVSQRKGEFLAFVFFVLLWFSAQQGCAALLWIEFAADAAECATCCPLRVLPAVQAC